MCPVGTWGTFAHEVGQVRAELGHFRESRKNVTKWFEGGVTNKYFTCLLLSAEKDQNPHYLQPKISFRSLNAIHTFWRFKTAAHLGLLSSQFAVMFYKSFFLVIYFLSAVATEIQAVQLTSNHNSDGGWAPKARSRSQTIDGNPTWVMYVCGYVCMVFGIISRTKARSATNEILKCRSPERALLRHSIIGVRLLTSARRAKLPK